MATNPWTSVQQKAFHEAVQSLKLYRRAELVKENSNSPLIEELYVDPLPNDQVFRSMMQPHTTFLIGRKGTGKSTVFQRVQHELRKSSDVASAYVDIKTVFESSQTESAFGARSEDLAGALTPESLQRLMLYRAFLKAVISQIQDELRNRIKASLWKRIKRTFTGSLDDLFRSLDALAKDVDADKFVNITALRSQAVQAKNETGRERDVEVGITGTVSKDPAIQASLSNKEVAKFTSGEEVSYSDLLTRVFNIGEYVARLKDLLAKAEIRRLYVFIDDFSELPEDAMRVVVDTVLAPLNNWSDELLKFKVAAYPGRIYYGKIDVTKIDEINLDLFKMYGSRTTEMQDKAIDFTRRLVESRINYFCRTGMSTFVDGNLESVWRVLFYASMANPRILGYILLFLYESHINDGRPITASAIGDAAEKYFVEKIETFFSDTKFTYMTYAERSSIYGLKELLETIVGRARQLRTYRQSRLIREVREKYKGRPPTSHFHVVKTYEDLLSTLELNFFVTKYYENVDRDSREVSVYALNYGLCRKQQIAFGRPSGIRFRTYYIERIFDYSPILHQYMTTNQEIICDNCPATFELDQLPALKLFRMRCPKCLVGTCTVINLSRKYEGMLKSVEEGLLLPKAEFGILRTLESERRAMYASELGEELDYSYQLIGKRSKILEERGLVNRQVGQKKRPQFAITSNAELTYFNPSVSDRLDVGDSDTKTPMEHQISGAVDDDIDMDDAGEALDADGSDDERDYFEDGE